MVKQKEPEIKQKTTFSVKLTKFELLHLRDLFGTTLAPDMTKTVSQTLAVSQDRVLIEAKLWQKLANACVEAGLPMNEDAPDFVVAPSGAPPMGVFELSSEPQTQQSQPDADDVGGLFETEDEDAE